MFDCHGKSLKEIVKTIRGLFPKIEEICSDKSKETLRQQFQIHEELFTPKEYDSQSDKENKEEAAKNDGYCAEIEAIQEYASDIADNANNISISRKIFFFFNLGRIQVPGIGSVCVAPRSNGQIQREQERIRRLLVIRGSSRRFQRPGEYRILKPRGFKWLRGFFVSMGDLFQGNAVRFFRKSTRRETAFVTSLI